MVYEGLRIDIRRQKIVEHLNQFGRVRVSDLSDMMHVSEVTIRNDLCVLEKNGVLERVPGGAVALHMQNASLPRTTAHAEEKMCIAIATAELVHDGETLMINSGTTTHYTALELKKRKNLNILTNSFAVAMELGSYPTFRVILLGGKINTEYSFTYGSDTLSQLGRYKADKAILAVDGVCCHAGLTTYHAEEAAINKAMIARSHQTIIVADSSKLGRESFNNFSDLSAAQCLVTNEDADEELLQPIYVCGMTVIKATQRNK